MNIFGHRFKSLFLIAMGSLICSTACLSDPAGIDTPGLDAGEDVNGSNGDADGDTSADDVDGDACTPLTCAQLDHECGEVPDGCGNILDCGDCGDEEDCHYDEGQQQNICKDEPCIPDEDVCDGLKCGMKDDGCGGQEFCGECEDYETCEDNQCGCALVEDEDFCDYHGAECGEFSGDDPCSDLGVERTATCSGCPSTSDEDVLCIENKCVPCDEWEDQTHCRQADAECGEIELEESCGGGSVDCGHCDDHEECTDDNQCCVPLSGTELCQENNLNCGDDHDGVDDGCGGTVDSVDCSGQDGICEATGGCDEDTGECCDPSDPDCTLLGSLPSG